MAEYVDDFQPSRSPCKRHVNKPAGASFKQGKLTKMIKGPKAPEKVSQKVIY